MERLRAQDFTAILEFLNELYGITDFKELPARLTHGLAALIPSDLTTYNEMSPGSKESRDCGSPTETMSARLIQRWRLVMHEHPVLAHQERTSDRNAYRISDFYSEQEFRGKALYQEFYRKMSIEDVLCKGISVNGQTIIGCALSRSRRTFAERDRLILNLAGPHLTQAWLNTRLIARLRLKIGTLEKTLESLDTGVIALSAGGRVRIMTPWARRVLEEFFGKRAVNDHSLPDDLRRWVVNRLGQFAKAELPQPAGPFVFSNGRSQLIVRLLREDSRNILLFQAMRPPARGVLTPREGEVLTLVAKGLTNKQIGELLRASPRTVQKHLERIFEKLDVKTRTQAAAFLSGSNGLAQI